MNSVSEAQRGLEALQRLAFSVLRGADGRVMLSTPRRVKASEVDEVRELARASGLFGQDEPNSEVKP
jgi:hypothetical protein